MRIKPEHGRLTLSRHEGESIIIGDNISIVVYKILGDKVRIAVEAPKDIRVMRKEIIKDELEIERE